MWHVFFLALILLEANVVVAARVDQWTVIGTIGKWQRADTKARLVIGMALKPNDIVEAMPVSSETGSLTILAGDTPKTYACDDPDSLPDKSNAGCVHPIAIPSESPEPEGSIARLFRQVRQLISGDSPRYYTAASRDAGSLTDAVVRATDHSLDLRPALSALSKGDYNLASEKLSGTRSASVPTSGGPVFPVHWSPDAKQTVVGPDLSPGLYHISAQSLDGDSAGDAWILVVTAESYDVKAQQYKAVKQQTESWDKNVPAATVRAILRATLDELSR